MAKVTDPQLREWALDLKDDKTDTSWCIFGYEGRDKIVPQKRGSAVIDTECGDGIDEWQGALVEDQVQFCLLRVVMGDRESKRPKFVMVSWVGSTVGVMKKAKVGIHKGSIKEFVGDIHLELHADDRDQIGYALIKKTLKAGMGADYDLGSNSRGTDGVQKGYDSQAKAQQEAAKAAYKQKEKGTTIGAVVFDAGPLSKEMTPCDISGRPTVASNTEAMKNTAGCMKDGVSSPAPKGGGTVEATDDGAEKAAAEAAEKAAAEKVAAEQAAAEKAAADEAAKAAEPAVEEEDDDEEAVE